MWHKGTLDFLSGFRLSNSPKTDHKMWLSITQPARVTSDINAAWANKANLP